MKQMLSGLVAAGVLTTGGAAWAGAKTSYPVVINTTTRTANGALGSARNSTDTVQYIGCLIGVTNSYTEFVRCFARNSAGTTVGCYSNNYNFIDAVQTINSDSYINFTYDVGGGCTLLEVTTSSITEPKR